MVMFFHLEKCDGCGKEITFPASWQTNKPPNDGWISIHTALGIRKDFCSHCLHSGVAKAYISELETVENA